jgi:hypothetical protein
MRDLFLIVLLAIFLMSAALAADIDQHGNSGVFVGSKTGMKVGVGTNNTIICQNSLLTAAQSVGIGNGLECLRFGSQSIGGTDYLPIGDVSSFVDFAQYFNSGRNGKTLCQIASSPWGAWQPTGEIPTDCGVHDYEAQRTCTQRPFDCNGTCPEPPTETSTVSIDNGECPECTDTSIYYTDTGIEASAYAATCPVGDSFLATNCAGDQQPRYCEMASCDDAGEWIYSHCYNPPESQGHTIKYYTNQCEGDQIEETFYCSTPYIGLYCCKRSDS